MKTLKKGLKQENVDSDKSEYITINYKFRQYIKIALYAAKDCVHLVENENKELANFLLSQVELYSQGKGAISFRKLQKMTHNRPQNHSNQNAWYSTIYAVETISQICFTRPAIHYAAQASPQFNKLEEYLSYARLFAYEDLDFPHKDLSRTFNLDNQTDLNIFLDFLTDNYPTAITYDREEYFTNKLAKEYLKVIYQ